MMSCFFEQMHLLVQLLLHRDKSVCGTYLQLVIAIFSKHNDDDDALAPTILQSEYMLSVFHIGLPSFATFVLMSFFASHAMPGLAQHLNIFTDLVPHRRSFD